MLCNRIVVGEIASNDLEREMFPVVEEKEVEHNSATGSETGGGGMEAKETRVKNPLFSEKNLESSLGMEVKAGNVLVKEEENVKNAEKAEKVEITENKERLEKSGVSLLETSEVKGKEDGKEDGKEEGKEDGDQCHYECLRQTTWGQAYALHPHAEHSSSRDVWVSNVATDACGTEQRLIS